MTSQTDTVRRFVTSQHGETVGEFFEVESGGKTDKDRHQLSSALTVCKKTKSTLVVAKLDRLSRNAEFLLRLQNAGVDFVCCDCPNVDRFTVGILALVAQRERELISERTKAGLQIVKSRGVRLGNPNGKRQVRLMVEGSKRRKEHFTKQIRPIIEEIRTTGVDTLQGICDCLTIRGIRTANGKNWYPSTVRNYLQ
jgi:DNA invertase Pin-like site-specific DNA recombinase